MKLVGPNPARRQLFDHHLDEADLRRAETSVVQEL